MGAPALRIPVALDLNSLAEQSQKASDKVGDTLKVIGKAFTKVNGDMLGIASTTAAGTGLAWSQSLARQALQFAAVATAGVVAYKLIAGAIDLTREKLEQMVEIADKSRDATVSAGFFQSFVAESQKLKVSAGDMEDALTRAFSATKDKAPIDLDKWEVGEERITDVEKALRVYNETLAKTAGTQLQGLVLFRDADTQEQKIKAVLQAMAQLEEIGQRAAALDLGEKMFGAKFVDNIRQGKTSAAEILDTMEKAAKSPMFSDDTVKRAKEVDDQLKLAQQRLDRELKPTFDGLANTMLTIKSLWADVVDLMARAFNIVNTIDLALKKDELRTVNEAIANKTGLFGLPQVPKSVTDALGMPSAQDKLIERRERLQREIFGLEGKPSSLAEDAGINSIGKTSRGAGAAPTLKQKDATRDRFEASADSIEKRTAATVAETESIDLNTAAREKARIAAQLQAVAMQVNKEAGLGENVVTDEQRKRIEAVAEAYGKAAAAIENARSPLATFARESANVGKQLNEFAASSLNGLTDNLAAVVTGTKTAAQAFKDMAASIISDLAKIAIRKTITGPIGDALFSSGGLFNVNGPGQPLDIKPPGQNAGGTDNWRGGLTWVGEKGIELANLPGGTQIVPNDVLRGLGGGGAPQVTVNLVEDSTRAGQVSNQSSNGGMTITAYVDKITAQNIGKPGSDTSKVLSASGVRQQVARR